jgi:uncharacterized membrane protein YbhN (UPF0104 family)
VLGGAFIGQTVAALRLARGGVPADLAGGTATVDMTVEAGTQALITLIGLVLLLAGGGSPVPGSIAALDIALALAAVAAMVALQRNLPVGLLQRAFVRLAPRWAASKPGWLVDFQGSIRRVHADRITLFRAACYHLGAWTLGAVEVSGILLLLGHPLSLVNGFVVESLTQALRNAAFMIPGGLGAQEAAIIASCGLVGVPADAALTPCAAAARTRIADRASRALRTAQNAAESQLATNVCRSDNQSEQRRRIGRRSRTTRRLSVPRTPA